MALTLGAPGSCNSDASCNFSLGSSIDLFVSQVIFIFTNTVTGVTFEKFLNFSTPFNLKNGVITTIVFNTEPGGSSILPPVCGDGVQISVQGAAIEASTGAITRSPTLNMTLVRSPCFSTEIRQFKSNTQQLFNCIGVDGTVGVAGLLVHCGSILGVGVCQALPSAQVHIGLLDPSTNIFYEYVLATTDSAGNFSVGFGVKNRSEVLALVPVNGAKQFSIVAMFDGDGANSRSAQAAITLSVRGEAADPCFLGTVLASSSFPTIIPPGELIHEAIASQTVSGVSITSAGEFVPSDLQTTAQKLITATHDAIVSAGAHPIDVIVYQGPPAVLLGFEGLGQITVPTLTVVSHSWGSPVAPAVILLAIVVALIALGIIIWFILQVVRDIVSLPGGAVALTAIAIGVIAVAGVGLYVLTRPRARRLLA